MQMREPHTITAQITGVRIVQNNVLNAWALFAFYLYLYPYGNVRW